MIRLLKPGLEKEVDAARRMERIEQELGPPEPQLLDTCVIQNLDWVDRLIESHGSVMWDGAAIADLTARYGAELASDLVDIGVLYKQFENRGGYPWLVSRSAQGEARLTSGNKRVRLTSAIDFFRGHQDDWSHDSYPAVAQGLLFGSRGVRVSPLLLRGLSVNSVDEIYAETGPLSFLSDVGDRMITAEALVANIPVILTTDRATFWKHRAKLEAFGVTVMRPTELLKLYEPYWEALDDEFMRRGNPKR